MIKDKIIKLVESAIGDQKGWSDLSIAEITIEKPDNPQFGDYAVSIAFNFAKQLKKSPQEVAQILVEEISKNKPAEIERLEAVGGYVNFFLSDEFLHNELKSIADDKSFGYGDSLKGKTIMVEYTDPNPFKLFHIGHLMTNTIGEAIARLYEASGAKVVRANYQGDVGMHVAKAVWGFMQKGAVVWGMDDLANEVKLLGEAYALGSNAYENKTEAKEEIDELNKKIYERSDEQVNVIYDLGRKWSLEYFKIIYQRLGTKFDNYFFESEMSDDGLALIAKNPKVFQKSQGAVVFKGEDYGLHTRVFINSQGLPTYEAKELGLNKKKFELYPLDLSVIVTSNEIVEYFRVLHKVMELIIPEVAAKTLHVPHGILRLASGKMSSRTGDVITADWLIDETKTKIREKENKENGLTEKEQEQNSEAIAIGAIKYSILKQSPGHDIIFDFDKSLSIEGDSGPYLQYAYARLRSILNKAGEFDIKNVNFAVLTETSELNIIKHLVGFPEAIKESSEKISPQYLAAYLYDLAGLSNKFYETLPVIKEPDENIKNARLGLIQTVAHVLKSGLGLLGIKTLDRI